MAVDQPLSNSRSACCRHLPKICAQVGSEWIRYETTGYPRAVEKWTEDPHISLEVSDCCCTREWLQWKKLAPGRRLCFYKAQKHKAKQCIVYWDTASKPVKKSGKRVVETRAGISSLGWGVGMSNILYLNSSSLGSHASDNWEHLHSHARTRTHASLI